MAGVDSYLTYRCNGCGYNYEDGNYCSHCGSPQCPKCNRAGCIAVISNYGIGVSQNMPLSASELNRGKPKHRIGKGKKKTPKKKRSLAELSEKLGIKLDL